MYTDQQLAEMTAAQARGEESDRQRRAAAAATPGVGALLDSTVGLPDRYPDWPRHGEGFDGGGLAPPPRVPVRPVYADPLVAGIGLPNPPAARLSAAPSASRAGVNHARMVDGPLVLVSPDGPPPRRGLRGRLRRLFTKETNG